MFHQLYQRSAAVKRHLAGPLLQDRLRYLEHYANQGMAQTTLRRIAGYLLIVIDYLHLETNPNVTVQEIETAATRWARHQLHNPRFKDASSQQSKPRFIREATHWLRFLNRLKIPASPPLLPQIKTFAIYMREERNLSEETIQFRCHETQKFLSQLPKHGRSLVHLTAAHIDAALIKKLQQGHYARSTIQSHATVLRTFFRYAESRDWCRPGIAAGIKAPRVYHHETLPSGPTWEEVQRLLKTTEGNHPTHIRDRAVLLLLAVYGLRAGEVRRLRLEDLDWENETLRIAHSKSGRLQQFPLIHIVGQAILRYLQKVRPCSRHREIFLSRRAPIRPLASGALFQLVNRRMKSLHISLVHRGPHALRHACATRLINQGASLKTIADQLGHRDLETTRIYAKVDLPRLREVADVNLGGLL